MTVMYTCHCFLAKDICRCCGKYAQPWLSYVNVIQGVTKEVNIHTKCIEKHWGRHERGVNDSRCKEFSTNKIAGKGHYC